MDPVDRFDGLRVFYKTGLKRIRQDMDYIVFDLEWNQGRLGKRDRHHQRLPFEIIEIGAVKLDENKNITDRFHRLIRPQVYRDMPKLIENMLGVDMKELSTGKPFTRVCREFLEWCGDDHIFCIWGNTDLIELQRNMIYFGMKPLSKLPFEYLDIQKLFSIAFEDGKQRRNLEYAIDHLKIEKDIPFHRAYADAYYTAKVFSHIDDSVLEYCSYDVFSLPLSKDDEIHKIFPSYSKYISGSFPDKAAAMSDKEVSSMRCYICGKNARRRVRWFSPGGRFFIGVSECATHGYIKAKVRLRHHVLTGSESEEVYVDKTQRLIDKEEYDEIVRRRDKVVAAQKKNLKGSKKKKADNGN